jgi:hypothetical protein
LRLCGEPRWVTEMESIGSTKFAKEVNAHGC